MAKGVICLILKNLCTFRLIAINFSHRRYFAIQLRKLFNKYKTNSPYLSQGTFSKLCSIRVLKERDIHRQNRLSKTPISVFVKSDLIEQFFEKHWAREEVKILFTGSSDRNFEKIPNIPKNIEMWFCQNSAISDNRRIFTLPIGLEDISLGRAGRPKFFGNSQIKINKSNKIFVPPMSPTNPIRRPTVLRCTNEKLFLNFFSICFRLVS
jgi:hypothetical protein